MHLEIIIIIAIIILLVLLLPVGAVLAYDFGDVILRVKVGHFLKLQLYPKKPRKKEKVKKPKKEKAKENDEKKSFSKDKIIQLIPLALSAANKFRKKLCVNELKIHYLVGGDDPYDIMKSYALASASVANILAMLHASLNIKSQDIRVNFDFLEEKSHISVACDLQIRIWQILYIAGFAGVQFIKIQKNNNNTADDERTIEDGEKSSK